MYYNTPLPNTAYLVRHAAFQWMPSSFRSLCGYIDHHGHEVRMIILEGSSKNTDIDASTAQTCLTKSNGQLRIQLEQRGFKMVLHSMLDAADISYVYKKKRYAVCVMCG